MAYLTGTFLASTDRPSLWRLFALAEELDRADRGRLELKKE